MSRARDVVPAYLVPRWSDLPGLAWAQARAFGPQSAPKPLGWALGVIAAPLWLGGLVGAHLKRGVAARGRRSVVMVTRISRILPPRAISLIFGVFCLLLAAGTVVAIAIGWFGFTFVLAIGLIGLASMRPWKLLRNQTVLAHVYAALHQADPAAEVYEVGGLAAWPPGQGHGWKLVDALLAEADVRGYVVLIPRDEALRTKYLERKMLEHEPSGALYLDLRMQGRHSTE